MQPKRNFPYCTLPISPAEEKKRKKHFSVSHDGDKVLWLNGMKYYRYGENPFNFFWRCHWYYGRARCPVLICMNRNDSSDVRQINEHCHEKSSQIHLNAPLPQISQSDLEDTEQSVQSAVEEMQIQKEFSSTSNDDDVEDEDNEENEEHEEDEEHEDNEDNEEYEEDVQMINKVSSDEDNEVFAVSLKPSPKRSETTPLPNYQRLQLHNQMRQLQREQNMRRQRIRRQRKLRIKNQRAKKQQQWEFNFPPTNGSRDGRITLADYDNPESPPPLPAEELENDSSRDGHITPADYDYPESPPSFPAEDLEKNSPRDGRITPADYDNPDSPPPLIVEELENDSTWEMSD